MSTKHLTTGSTEPPKEEGKLRLYSMEYCPYAHRVRLVLRAKGVPHDIVNLNLINKPEWYFKIHPEGKVPALDTGSEVLVESLNIAEYLEKKYPSPLLYPAEPEAAQKDKELIKKLDAVTSVFTKCIVGLEQKSPEEWTKEFLGVLQPFEDELKRRGTKYFGGDNPGMVDYMLWPWAERAKTAGIVLQAVLPFAETDLPLLRQWKKIMRNHPVVDGIYHGPEKFFKCIQIKTKVIPPDYDII